MSAFFLRVGFKYTYLLPQCIEPLLLSMCVNVGADHKGDDVEEGNPCLLRQEFLGKRQCQRRCNPADLHDGHETCPNRGSDLVKGSCTGDDSHRGKVHRVLYG